MEKKGIRQPVPRQRGKPCNPGIAAVKKRLLRPAGTVGKRGIRQTSPSPRRKKHPPADSSHERGIGQPARHTPKRGTRQSTRHKEAQGRPSPSPDSTLLTKGRPPAGISTQRAATPVPPDYFQLFRFLKSDGVTPSLCLKKVENCPVFTNFKA